jgi:hypothetical protein
MPNPRSSSIRNGIDPFPCASAAGEVLSELCRLRQGHKVLALNIVKKGLLALLMFVLALQTGGFSCGIAEAGATIKDPCCGGNCPVVSSSAGQTCCQAEDSTGVAALSAKPSIATFQASAARFKIA